MEADRGERELFGHDRAEQVLASVLLHVVKPTHGINQASGVVEASGPWCVENMDDVIRFFDDIENLVIAERAKIVRLAAGAGIERGAVQRQPQAIVGAMANAGGEVPEVGVVIVKSVGQTATVTQEVQGLEKVTARRPLEGSARRFTAITGQDAIGELRFSPCWRVGRCTQP